MMINIDKLSWKIPDKERYAYIMTIQNLSDNDIKAIIMPAFRQDCWEGCATLLAALDDKRFIPLLPQLLQWYMDMNWPGFEIMDRRIRDLPKEQMKPAVLNALEKARTTNDEEWYENLSQSFLWMA